ncbi:MAG: hypothetical protein Tp1111DCM1126091_133 [Prokaryotic dsDNA virus sp.]|nr:MAG: hypothetical protein Tp1111DCM1126091_133 [Prokaryotic dsDNA virus sp.]|tara:strand:+ start:17072 stop:17278 length:207 start_codon:yes stop_codon:yes gene_type:complete
MDEVARKNYQKRRREIKSIAKQMLPVCYQNYTEYAREYGFDPEWRTGIAIDARDCARALVDVLEELEV